MCPSVVVYAVDHIVAPSPSNNTHKICIWICVWNNYVWYTLVCVHFIVCSMYVSSCSTPSFSSPANSAIPTVITDLNTYSVAQLHDGTAYKRVTFAQSTSYCYVCVQSCDASFSAVNSSAGREIKTNERRQRCVSHQSFTVAAATNAAVWWPQCRDACAKCMSW